MIQITTGSTATDAAVSTPTGTTVTFTPPIPPMHPCPACGHCPCCGRGGIRGAALLPADLSAANLGTGGP
jgi:hypothetical protein